VNKTQIQTLKETLSIDLSNDKIAVFEKYEKIFLEKNSHTNLISKNDEKFLFEKHIFDSLAINKFFTGWLSLHPRPLGERAGVRGRLLDVGTGGGFPSVPVAILYDDINVFALDSIRKKINIIDELKVDLGLKNLFPICERAENLQLKNNPKFYDYVTTRAVAKLDVIIKYAIVNLKPGGHLIAYKSKKALDELKDAEKTIKSLGVKMIDIIKYTLPLEEIHERNLIIFQKKY
jgi:16S rRNA (guanine527-N7)-methyltransferase